MEGIERPSYESIRTLRKEKKKENYKHLGILDLVTLASSAGSVQYTDCFTAVG